MSESPLGAKLIADNYDERARLAALVGRLTDADLGCSLGGGWVVATALAHLAFWDRRAMFLLDHWEHGRIPPAGEPDWYGSELLNDGLLAEWRALPPREAARLALEAAEAVDRKIETHGHAEAIVARDESWMLRRSLHRCEHLEQIERGLNPWPEAVC